MTTQFPEHGQRITLQLDGMGRLGEAIASIDGKPVFVFGGLPGEKVEVEIIRERRRYIAAEVISVIKPSPYRQQAPCKYFGECTGCQLQNVVYSHQLELKRMAIIDAFQRIGNLDNLTVLPTLPSPKELGYRNHARFTVRRQTGRLGYIHRERRNFVDVDECLLMDSSINEHLSSLQGNCGETSQVAVRSSPTTGSYLIQPTLKNFSGPPETGQKSYIESAMGVDFRVGSPSFFQVNIQQLENLARLVKEELNLDGTQVIVDAYAGVGTFSALLAPFSHRVLAIEESSAAIDDAELNLSSFPNVVILKGKTEEVLPNVYESIDALIVDPSRAGCQRPVLDAIMRLAPKRLVYISCDPGSLARDISILVNGPYKVDSIQPLDMFPQTHHVECLTSLSLRAGHPIILASKSPRRRNILADANIPFNQTEPEDYEMPPEGCAKKYAISTALTKAKDVAKRTTGGLVLAADSVVVMGNEIFNKPDSEYTARIMLDKLRNSSHKVITGVAVVNTVSNEIATAHKTTTVHMRNYSNAEIDYWIGFNQALDKAGGYAIQDSTFSPAHSVEGCYLNVVGLPLCLTATLLEKMGAEFDTGISLGLCNNCNTSESDL